MHTASSNTVLRPPWLWLARLVWLVLVVAVLAVTVGFMPIRFEQIAVLCQQDAQASGMPQLSLVCTGLRSVGGVLLLLTSLIVTGLALSRRSDDWLVLFAVFMTTCTAALFGFMSALVLVPPAWQVPTLLIRILSPLTLFVFLYFFPDGRFVPRFALPGIIFSIALPLSWVLFPGSPLNVYNLANWPLPVYLILLALVMGVAAQIYRYFRIANAAQRQQTKWILIGTVATVPAFLIVYLPVGLVPQFREPGVPRLLHTLFAEPFFQLTYAFSLICTVIAMLRYRLWDIDIIIRRTVIYGTLAALLALVYFGIVVVLQQLFASLSGQRSELVTVLSTLVIAALFVPLRNGLQTLMDRHFNRQHYDSQRVLQKFGELVRDETDLEKLTNELVNVVQETLQPTHVSVWLSETEQARRNVPVGTRGETSLP